MIETLYPELKEPKMTISEIISILMRLTDNELETLDEDKFAAAMVTLYN